MISQLNLFKLLTMPVPWLNFHLQNNVIQKYRKIISVSHRGASLDAPENTLAGFKIALSENAEIIELDLHLAHDGSIMVIHDSNTKRTTGTDHEVKSLNLSQLKELNAGILFGDEFKDEKIPTLEEVLKLVDGKCKLLVELKWPRSGVYSGFVQKVLALIKEHKAAEWVIIQSFERTYLKEALRNVMNVECHQLVYGWSRIFPIYFDHKIRFGRFRHLEGIKSFTIYYPYLSRKFVAAMHRKNIKVFVFTLNESEKIAKAVNLGADGIISDDHKLATELMEAVSV